MDFGAGSTLFRLPVVWIVEVVEAALALTAPDFLTWTGFSTLSRLLAMGWRWGGCGGGVCRRAGVGSEVRLSRFAMKRDDMRISGFSEEGEHNGILHIGKFARRLM